MNYYVLVPRFFIPRKYLRYISVCTVSVFITVGVPSLLTGISDNRQPPKPWEEFPGPAPERYSQNFPDPSDFNRPPPDRRVMIIRPEFRYIVLICLLILALSMGIRILIQWQFAEKEKINAELSSLKAQINPHFLFNTMNSIYSLSVNKSERTSYAIEKFSEMLRFVVYETNHDFVSLEKNIEYIENYITLQKFRLPPGVHVNYSFEGDPINYRIAPLILLPFIENAFKHGISTETDTTIDISLTLRDNELTMIVKNRNLRTAFGETSQVGINNTKKRLDLMYPGKHSLKIEDNETDHIVILKIDLL
jgi:hypothetical protein